MAARGRRCEVSGARASRAAAAAAVGLRTLGLSRGVSSLAEPQRETAWAGHVLSGRRNASCSRSLPIWRRYCFHIEALKAGETDKRSQAAGAST